MRCDVSTSLFVILIAAVCAPTAFAKDPDPLTIEFAKGEGSIKDCEAFEVSYGPEDGPPLNGFERVTTLIDESSDVDPYTIKGKKREALIAEDLRMLASCARSPDGYFLYGQVERYLVDAKEKGASAERAVKAFDLAVALSEDCKVESACPQALAHRAGALALLGRSEDAFKSLKDAIDAGFLAVGWFSNSPILSELRKHPEWDKRLAAMLPPSIGPMPEALPDDLTLSISEPPLYRTSTTFGFCKDKRITKTIEVMAESTSWEVGTWERKEDGIWATFSQECHNEEHEEGKPPKVVCETQPDAKPERILSTAEMRAYLTPGHEEPGFSPTDTPHTLCRDEFKPPKAPK